VPRADPARRLRERIPPARRQQALQLLHRLRRPAWFGTLRRTTPVSDVWGFDRGLPVDRYYIEQFLDAQRADIRGRVLEVRDAAYTRRFGSGVARSEVLDINPANPRATIVADLAAADAVPSAQFDCFILTQTLQFIYDARSAIGHARRLLEPGGVLLATVPATSRLAPRIGLAGDYWRFTPAACARLFGDTFGPEQVAVRSYGNVLAGMAFLAGLAAEELSRRELDSHDPYFPLVVAVRAVKQ
jgi:SAM-dependent methyltransferase